MPPRRSNPPLETPQLTAHLVRHAAPFRLVTDPGRIVVHRSWGEARDRVLMTLAGDADLVALLGPPGAGKTLLLHDLARICRSVWIEARLLPFGEAASDAGPGGIVLVDEAARMDDATLDRLAQGAAGPCVIAGLPCFAERLAELSGRVATVTLAPLEAEEVGGFIALVLARSGHDPDLFTEAAVRLLARNSGGLIRPLNILCGTAMRLALGEGENRVEARHVAEAVAIRNGDDPMLAAEA